MLEQLPVVFQSPYVCSSALLLILSKQFITGSFFGFAHTIVLGVTTFNFS